MGHSEKLTGSLMVFITLCIEPSTSMTVLKWDSFVGQAGEGNVEVKPLSL